MRSTEWDDYVGTFEVYVLAHVAHISLFGIEEGTGAECLKLYKIKK